MPAIKSSPPAEVAGTTPAIGRLERNRRFGLRLLLPVVCLFFVIWGTKIGVVDRYGSDIPNWDQWDAESETLFLPYLRGELTTADFFRPHNEHRIALTRLLALGLLVANGQWDSRLECVTGAALHALCGIGWFLLGCAILPEKSHGFWWVVVAALVAPPYSWQNITGGFHTQQYFLLGLSTFAIALTLTGRPWSGRWWTGMTCAVLALFSMASGLLAAAAILGTLVVAGLRDRTMVTQHKATLVLTSLIVICGLLLHESFAGHSNLGATSFREFVLTFWRNLQWPMPGHPLFPVLAILPLVIFAVFMFTDSARPSRGRWAVLAAGAWVLLQYAATAYARGAGAPFPASRYLDTNVFGIGLLMLIGLLLMNRASIPAKLRLPRAGLFVVYTGFMAVGLWNHLSIVINYELPAVGRELERREANTRAYLATNDPSHLSNGSIPYPNAPALMARLESDEIRGILPASIRAPLEIEGDAEPPGSFARGGVPASLSRTFDNVWGSYTAAGPGATCIWTGDMRETPRLPWLRFQLTGRSDAVHTALSIAFPGDKALERIVAASLQTSGWTPVVVRTSRRAVTLQAIDDDPDGWIGFSAPVEMGDLSVAAMGLAQRGFPLALIAFLVGLAGFIVRFGPISPGDDNGASPAQPAAS